MQVGDERRPLVAEGAGQIPFVLEGSAVKVTGRSSLPDDWVVAQLVECEVVRVELGL